MKKINIRKVGVVVIAGVVTLTLMGATSSCSSDGVNEEQATTETQLQLYLNNQPIPVSDWSQLRQTIIDAEQAQIHGVATTSFFLNQGVDNPIMVCPSIGFPVASTAQLSNPLQWVGSGGAVVGQMEPNGVYTGDSSATWVTCVTSDGTRYMQYAEELVHTVGAPAHWDNEQGMIVLDGPPTVIATEQPE